MDKDVKKWRERLQKNFTLNNNFKILSKVSLKELKSEEYFRNHFGGYQDLLVAYKEFLAITLRIIKNILIEYNKKKDGNLYNTIYNNFILDFRLFRSAQKLAQISYAGPGYCLLRKLFFNSVYKSAIMNGYLSYNELMGSKDLENKKENESMKKYLIRWSKKKKKAQQKAKKYLWGKESTLPDNIKKDILYWLNFFHNEVHGSNLSQAKFFKNGKSVQLGSIYPDPEKSILNHYVSRSIEVAWIHLRTLCIFNFYDDYFKNYDYDWVTKWKILDESFEESIDFAIEDNQEYLGKSLKEFIQLKFNFNPNNFNLKDNFKFSD